MYQIDFNHPVHVYFVGIGGISMSGLAEILKNAGFRVSGSDRSASELTDTLIQNGITVKIGQRASNITPDIDVAVLTSAIREDNPEWIALKEASIPTLSRAELLGQLMKNYELPIAVSGTHGKTTTTSMLSEILLAADTNPTLSIGGILKSIGGNIRVGNSSYFVTEACEYTNSFLSFFPKISIILNIDADHLDFFKDLDDIRHSFRKFAQLLPADGHLIINGTIPNLSEITEGLPCKIVTFGPDASYDYYPEGIAYNVMGCASFTAHTPKGNVDISLKVPGEHNILNALAALATADILAVETKYSAKALSLFEGTDRRFQYKGNLGGITVVDDYAHHPTEITATLTAAQKIKHHTIWCVFQPHTFTRTKALMKEFATALSLADRVVLADIYPARETDNLGISSETLQKEIQALGATCDYFKTFDEIENFLLQNCTKDDLLITMGAGDVHIIGEKLLGL